MGKTTVGGTWSGIGTTGSFKYRCGFCSEKVASEKGWESGAAPQGRIRVCPHCNHPTLFAEGAQTPGTLEGEEIGHLPADVDSLHLEARQAMAGGAHTAAVLALRKLLMHVAVDCGATAGDTFASYVKYLADNHYVPPRAIAWVDKIRQRSNEANHQIVLMTASDAKELLAFTQMLLKLVYEYPALAAPPPP